MENKEIFDKLVNLEILIARELPSLRALIEAENEFSAAIKSETRMKLMSTVQMVISEARVVEAEIGEQV